MFIRVCGIGLVSAIGVGSAENFSSLLSSNCGIGALTLFDSAVDVPVGQVKRTNGQLKELLGIAQTTTISRTALLGAIAAREAIDDAQIPAGSRIGLISSTTVGGMDLSENFYADFRNNPNSGRLRDIVGHDCGSSTEFIARQCGITGFRTTISTACSSAANAVIMGAEMLKCDMLDYVLVGGVDSLCRFTLNGFNSLMILDKGLCRPLDRDRNGLNLGEGAGYLVLAKNTTKSYCSLSGYANANDAFHQTASSDNGQGAYLSMCGAIERAGILPCEIDYINLHGTGTQNNDSSEMAAVGRVFGDDVPPCSSTKCYTGHTLAAAGAIEAVYSILAIQNGVRYANLRFENPIEGAASPLTQIQRGVTIKNVLSNSFGFGGNCSSLIFSKE
ncbi:MAG: beta-ketoacyl-[acyl-carrier-protein] synthase family protein [Mucinivorans sp.]